MNGQWLGRYTGTNSGIIVIELDELGSYYEGRAYAFDDNSTLPSTVAWIKTLNKGNEARQRVQLLPIDSQRNQVTTWDQIISRFPPDLAFPVFADVEFRVTDDTLNVAWRTNIETFGAATITRSKADTPTEYQPLPDVTNWEQFKSYVNVLEHRRYIFRGQNELKRLRTSFHRRGRADLARFLANDIQTLYRHLSLRTGHVFNLMIPDENGAFFNLLQHHGYPTPLLDWTYSPFVGAFFAYHRLRKSEAALATPDQKVRIFVFDEKSWREKINPQVAFITPVKPHFSIMEFIAIDNPRLVPQQSISSLTNVDDIETYIHSLEIAANQSFLKIVDLPVSERSLVMQELSVMGITAGSLFPGIDGTCEELRERFFPL